MLKITRIATAKLQKWMLCGQLAGPWVAELRAAWREKCRQCPADERCVFDLSDVTFIDESGEILLREMQNDGAEFVAAGVDTRNLLENLKTKEAPSLRKFLPYLAHECGQPREGD